MSPSESDPTPSTRLSDTLLASVWAASLGALVGGATDALLAWSHFRGLPDSAVDATRMDRASDLLGGVAGATMLHLGIQVAALLPVALLLYPVVLRRRSQGGGRAILATLALSLPLFGLGYWHTREIFFYGLPATSPERLATAAGLAVAALVVGALVGVRVARAPRAGRRALGALALASALLGLVWASWSARADADRGALNERNAGLPNVIVIVVDALRPDVLGCYGNATVETPHIDRLAEGGAVFDAAYANAPFTGASFGSFFTGQYPRRHGMLTMGPGVEIESGMTFTELLDGAVRDDGTPMQDGDVIAASFMTGALSHGSGLMAGFDAYRELTLGHALVELGDRWSVFRAELVPSLLWSKLEARLDPDLLVHAARDWMGEHADRRFAMFVHLYSTHTPYDPPEPFRSKYVDPDYDGPIQSFYAGHRIAIEQGEYTPTPEDVRRIYDLYLGGVSLADHHVGLLVDELERRGLLEDTLIVVTSDHGEDFGAGADPRTGDPGRWEHNHMYRSNLQIPLVAHWPAGFEGGQRVAASVEGVDLVPTLLDAAGLRTPESDDPRDVIDGRSLLPLLRGERQDHKPYLFAEDATFVSIQDGARMLTLERYAVKPDGWRIALDEGLGEVRYHDFAQDPSGERDLFADVVRGRRPEVAGLKNRQAVLADVERLRSALLQWNASQPIDVETVDRSERDLESETNRDALYVKQLEELGYVEGWDQYAGALRDRVLAERAAREEAGSR